MSGQHKTPRDLARRLAAKPSGRPRGTGYSARADSGWRRESFVLPRAEARQKARD